MIISGSVLTFAPDLPQTLKKLAERYSHNPEGLGILDIKGKRHCKHHEKPMNSHSKPI